MPSLPPSSETFHSARRARDTGRWLAALALLGCAGSSTVALVLGAITLGIAVAGGDLMWMLWVTKFAPADKVADYMGLHTFFTGVRAVLAPLLAFVVVGQLPLHWIATISAMLMILSSAILVPEVRAERRRVRLEAVPVRVVAGD